MGEGVSGLYGWVACHIAHIRCDRIRGGQGLGICRRHINCPSVTGHSCRIRFAIEGNGDNLVVFYSAGGSSDSGLELDLLLR